MFNILKIELIPQLEWIIGLDNFKKQKVGRNVLNLYIIFNKTKVMKVT
jgi:hypothetical protein